MDQSRTASDRPDAFAAFIQAASAQAISPREEGVSETVKQESMNNIRRALQTKIRSTHLAAREKKLRNCDFEIRNLSPSKKVNFNDIQQ